jgi:hypothetical protein
VIKLPSSRAMQLFWASAAVDALGTIVSTQRAPFSLPARLLAAAVALGLYVFVLWLSTRRFSLALVLLALDELVGVSSVLFKQGWLQVWISTCSAIALGLLVMAFLSWRTATQTAGGSVAELPPWHA